jgi:hypothetical protein
MNVRGLVFLIAVLVGACAPSAASASRWSAADVLGRDVGKSGFPKPRAAINARGQAVVAYVANRNALRVVLRSRAGRFGPAVTLAAARAQSPAVAIGREGTVAVAWIGFDGRLRVAVRRPGHRFGRPQTIGTAAYAPWVAVDSRGNVTAMWARFGRPGGGGQDGTVQTAFRPVGGRFGAPVDLGLGRLGDHLPIAFDAGGTATLVWTGPPALLITAGSPTLVAERPLGGTVTTPQTLSGTPTYDASVAVGGGGVAAVVWVDASGPETDPYGAIEVSRRATARSPFGPAERAPFRVAEFSFNPAVAVGSSGTTFVAWQEKTRPEPFRRAAPLVAAVAPPGARFGPRLTVTADKILAPRLAQLSRGRVAMVWAGQRMFAGALYRPRAGLRKLPAPPGHPPKGASTNSQWFDGAGAHGILVWIRRGSVHESILTIG